MSSVLAIAKRDLSSLLKSPLFYLIASFCTIFWSFIYLRSLFNFAGQLAVADLRGASAGMNIHYQLFVQHITIVNFLLMVTVPMITMRLISEEKRQRTYDLLLTAPLTATHIALGKFVAGIAATSLLILIAFLYPIGTGFIADFSWSPLITSFLGILFLASVYVATGLFASSLTSSAMLSALMGVLFNLGIWSFTSVQVSSNSDLVSTLFNHLSVGIQFTKFLKGTIDISGIIFFITTAGFFVFLSQRVVESARWR